MHLCAYFKLFKKNIIIINNDDDDIKYYEKNCIHEIFSSCNILIKYSEIQN
jgi:hypothetical protein